MSDHVPAPAFVPGTKPRTAGFRFFWSDALFIAGLCALAWFARDAFGPLLWIIPFAAGHFFLFCNVFRVRRSYELVWTGCCLANFAGWHLSGAGGGWAVLATQTPATLIVFALELRSPRYHGIGARRINARLDEYLAGATF
jgi:hypothetical protein